MRRLPFFSFLKNIRVAGFLCVAGVGLAAAGCSVEQSGNANAGETAKAAVRPAKLLEITPSSRRLTVSLPAIIEASASSELTFQVGGLLKELNVREGEHIAKGAIIARLDQRDFRNDLATAQAQYNSAETEFQRAERLIMDKAISQSVYEQRKTQKEVAQATLDSARKRLDDSVLRSPFAGVVAIVHTEQFQNITAHQPVATLQTTGAAEAVVQAPATLIVHSGRVVPTDAVVMLDVTPGVRMPAELHSIATQADPNTQTFEAKFAFTPLDGLVILPGMTGSVQASLTVSGANGDTEQITVPLSAILADGDGRYVWVVNPDNMTVSRRDIALGDGVGDKLEVLEGLEAGEIIVGAGASYLYEGMQIRPFEH